LADQLPERPVYGVRAIGLLDGEVPHGSVSAMAAYHLSRIKSVQPSGPYLIGGNCAPAVVALEIAQRLASAGESVAGLTLVDPSTNAPSFLRNGFWLRFREAQRRARGPKAVMAARLFPKMAGDRRRRMLRRAIQGAVAGYTPGTYGGATLLICSSARAPILLNPANGYPRLLTDLAIATIDGGHRSVLRAREDAAESPVTPASAAAIATFLNRVMPV
jgi:hypothetical protein